MDHNLEQVNVHDLWVWHQELFDNFEKEVDARDRINKENGCTCGWDEAVMYNAGTGGMEMGTKYGQFDEFCPLCGSDPFDSYTDNKFTLGI